jgi:hypothetical protein
LEISSSWGHELENDFDEALPAGVYTLADKYCMDELRNHAFYLFKMALRFGDALENPAVIDAIYDVTMVNSAGGELEIWWENVNRSNREFVGDVVGFIGRCYNLDVLGEREKIKLEIGIVDVGEIEAVNGMEEGGEVLEIEGR